MKKNQINESIYITQQQRQNWDMNKIKGESCKSALFEKYKWIENLKKWVSWKVYFRKNNHQIMYYNSNFMHASKTTLQPIEYGLSPTVLHFFFFPSRSQHSPFLFSLCYLEKIVFKFWKKFSFFPIFFKIYLIKKEKIIF